MTPLQLKPNTTCDIYHAPSVPPAAPDVAAVPIFLEEAFVNLKTGTIYDHVVHFALGKDVRDNDYLFIPDKNGVGYTVKFVARRGWSTDQDHKVAYVSRGSPVAMPWPTDYL